MSTLMIAEFLAAALAIFLIAYGCTRHSCFIKEDQLIVVARFAGLSGWAFRCPWRTSNRSSILQRFST